MKLLFSQTASFMFAVVKRPLPDLVGRGYALIASCASSPFFASCALCRRRDAFLSCAFFRAYHLVVRSSPSLAWCCRIYAFCLSSCVSLWELNWGFDTFQEAAKAINEFCCYCFNYQRQAYRYIRMQTKASKLNTRQRKQLFASDWRLVDYAAERTIVLG